MLSSVAAFALLLLLGAVPALADELGEARAAVTAVRRAPLDAEAWCAAGEAVLDAGDPRPALALFEHALRWGVGSERAQVGRARALLALQRPAEALRALRRVRAPDPRTQALTVIALVEMGRPQRAKRAARRALRAGPHHADVVAAAARAAYRRGDMDRATLLYRRAADLDPHQARSVLRLGSGFGPWIDGALWRRPGERARFDQAVRAWRRSDLSAARATFYALVRDRPQSFKHRLGLGTVLRELDHRRAGPFGGDAPAIYALLPAPALPGEAGLIPGFASLPPSQQHVLRVALAPARPWLPALLAAGARHDVLPMTAGLTDHEERRAWAHERTFDGRWYAHLRGCGGQHAATGEEKLRSATAFGFHTFAHELAHQLLTYALPADLRADVQALYETALEEGRCLDHYAASNVDEYFAQGYEAFVSHDKRLGLRRTAGHTRAELARRDPALHDLLQLHLDLSHETSEALKAYRAAIEKMRHVRDVGAYALLDDARSGALLSRAWPHRGLGPGPR